MARSTLVLAVITAIGTLSQAALSQATMPATGPATTQSRPATQSKPAIHIIGHVGIRVIDDKTQEPLSDVSVTAQFTSSDRRNDVVMQTLKTDQQGRCAFGIPDKPIGQWRLYPSKADYVPLRVYWGGGQKPPLMPQEFTLPMSKAVPIGGVVKDEQGQPIAGVVVAIHHYGKEQGLLRVNLDNLRTTTDKDGRWQFDQTPAAFGEDSEPRIFLKHKDYISDPMVRGYIPMPKYPLPELKKLQALTAEYVMKSGLKVEGRVTDSEGHPLAAARVAVGEESFSAQAVRSDKDGHFSFTAIEAGNQNLVVTARGFAPHQIRVAIQPAAKLVEVKLAKAKILRGRIMDKQGRPVAGAGISVDEWGGSRMLQWNTQTDAQGRFAWNDAPAGAVSFYISKQGYMMLHKSLTALDEEQILTLPNPLLVRGKVLDAQSSQPVERFQVFKGISWGQQSSPPSWEQRDKAAFTDGTFQVTFEQPYPGHLVRIEAEGYKPLVSRSIADDEGEVTLELKLEKGKPIAGALLGLDGKPLGGVNVYICTSGVGVYVQNGKVRADVGAPRGILASADGKFSFPPEGEKYSLVAVTDDGYVETTQEQFEAAGQVRLQPWATIEGKVMLGDKAAGGMSVSAHNVQENEPSRPRVFFDLKTKTDESGGFCFRVPPGDWAVQRFREVSMGGGRTMWANMQSERVPTLKPGQTAQVTIGGTGRPVIGKIILPPEVQVPLQQSFCSIRSQSRMPKPPVPANFETLDRAQQTQWYQKWSQTEEGKAYQAAQIKEARSRKYFGLSIELDGSFRVDDVPAGSYALQASFASDPDQREVAAIVTHEFIIPEMSGGRSDEPLDLGTLTAKSTNEAAGRPTSPVATAPAAQTAGKLLGQPLPDLQAMGVKSSSELASGKRLIVCVLDSGQRPSRQVAQELAESAPSLADKGAVVVLIHAGDPKQGQQWLASNKIAVLCGQVPAGQTEKMLVQWGAARMPWIVVTDDKHVVRAEGVNLADLDDQLK